MTRLPGQRGTCRADRDPAPKARSWAGIQPLLPSSGQSVQETVKSGLLSYIQECQGDPEVGYRKHAGRCLPQICKYWCFLIRGLILAFIG